MTDLVTRLRALAKIAWDADRTDMEDALSEAADALERAKEIEIQRDSMAAQLPDLQQERDALKAKLAEALEDAWTARNHSEDRIERAEKAEAEAAALREAGHLFLRWFSDRESAATCNQAMQAFRVALSQPGPGAAMLERVKKLEAVAEAQKENLEISDDYAEMVARRDEARAALAALREKP